MSPCRFIQYRQISFHLPLGPTLQYRNDIVTVSGPSPVGLSLQDFRYRDQHQALATPKKQQQPRSTTTMTMTAQAAPRSAVPKQLVLHDCVALGQVEEGLFVSSSSTTTIASSNTNTNISINTTTATTNETTVTTNTVNPCDEELQRLPILLRLLSSARPLSSVPKIAAVVKKGTATIMEQDDEQQDEDDEQQKQETNNTNEDTEDALIQRVVDRLEDRAAIYSAAEGVEVMACHLAPFLCKRLSKLPPLLMVSSKRGGGGGGAAAAAAAAAAAGSTHTTTTTQPSGITLSPSGAAISIAHSSHRKTTLDELKWVATNPLVVRASRKSTSSSSSSRNKRRKLSHHPVSPLSGATGRKEDWIVHPNERGEDEEEEEDDDDDLEEKEAVEDERSAKRPLALSTHQKHRRNSDLLTEGDADSQEATAAKTLSELVSLVVESLQPIPASETEAATAAADTTTVTTKVASTMTTTKTTTRTSATTTTIATNAAPASTTASTPLDEDGAGGGTSTGQDGQGNEAYYSYANRFQLSMDDSILAQARPSTTSSSFKTTGRSTSANMMGADLAATVAALMVHAPVLTHQHVAVRV